MRGLVFVSILLLFINHSFAQQNALGGPVVIDTSNQTTKYYLGVEDRSSMTGQLISKIYLLVERTTKKNSNSVTEQMLVVTPYGNFDAEMEFVFDTETAFHVVNKSDDKEVGQGISVGLFDNPTSMMDTTSIQQTKEKAIAVFSFDGPRLFVGKVFYSLDTGNQTGFSVEKCLEISGDIYNQLKNKPDTIIKTWQGMQF